MDLSPGIKRRDLLDPDLESDRLDRNDLMELLDFSELFDFVNENRDALERLELTECLEVIRTRLPRRALIRLVLDCKRELNFL